MIKKKFLLEKIIKLEENENNLNKKIINLETELKLISQKFDLLENYCKEVNEGIKNKINQFFEPIEFEDEKKKAELERKKFVEDMLNMYSYE